MASEPILNFKIPAQTILKFKISKDLALSAASDDEILTPRLTAKF
jgi:hypothetical protein